MLGKIKLAILFIYAFFYLGNNETQAKAWLQRTQEGFSTQKILFNSMYQSDFLEKADLNNSLAISNKVQELGIENYFEYGLMPGLTLEAQFSVKNIMNNLSYKSNAFNINIEKMKLLYQKLNAKFSLIRGAWISPTQAFSVYNIIDPGEYIMSPIKEEYRSKRWNIGLGLAYGEGVELNSFFKSRFYEIVWEAKYYPKLQIIEQNINFRAGFKINDNLTLTGKIKSEAQHLM